LPDIEPVATTVVTWSLPALLAGLAGDRYHTGFFYGANNGKMHI
jgi:hypothetical protein